MSCDNCKSITLFKGSDGRTIYNGSGAPTLTTANAGDFYIDTTAWEIYGPYTGSSWGSGTSLIGPAGAQGVYGAWSSEWDYDAGSTGSGTGTEDFRFNNATLASVTTLYINETNGDAANLTAWLAAWNNSGNFGLVRISKKTDANVFWMGEVTSVTGPASSEYTMGVTHVASNGTFTDNDACVISFVRNGAAGAAGSTGTSNTGKTLWVDDEYGNDGTGTVDRHDLPYKTYAAAAAAATKGESIIVRTGDYSESFVLYDDIYVYCEVGVVINGSVTDNGVGSTCKLLGYPDINSTTATGIDCTGPGSNLFVEAGTVTTTTGSAIAGNPSSGTNKLTVLVKRLTGTTLNYSINARRGATMSITVLERIGSATLTGDYSMIATRDSFSGVLTIKAPLAYIGNSTTSNIAGILLDNNSSTATAIIDVEIETVQSDYAYATPAEAFGTITNSTLGTVNVRIDRLTTITRAGITISGTDVNKTYFRGNIYCEGIECIRHAGVGKLIVEESSFHRGDAAGGGVDANWVAVFGVPTVSGSASWTGAQTNGYKFEAIRSVFVKTSATGDGNGFIARDADGATPSNGAGESIIMFKDCEILGLGALATGTPYAFDFDAAAAHAGPPAYTDSDIYLKDTRCTHAADDGVTLINQTEVVESATGFTVSDTALTTYKIIEP